MAVYQKVNGNLLKIAETNDEAIGRIDSLEETVSTKVSKSGDTMTGPLANRAQAIDLSANNPTSWQYASLYQIKDKNGTEIGGVYGIRGTANESGVQLEVAKVVDGTRLINNVRLLIKADGTKQVSLSDPAVWRSVLAVLPLAGGTLTGNVYFSATSRGYYLKDSAGNNYPLGYDNGTNLWIGATATAATHHKGSTYISAGHNGTSGNTTIYVCVPNAANTNGTNYGVYHTGNKPSASDVGLGNVTNNKQMPIAGETFTGNAVAYSTNRTGANLRNINVQNSSGTNQSTNYILMRRK